MEIFRVITVVIILAHLMFLFLILIFFLVEVVSRIFYGTDNEL